MELSKLHQVLFEKIGDCFTKVTICISLYNYETYILETLESVYKQTSIDLDLLIVDDSSKDNSLKVAQLWVEQRQSRFNTIRLVQHLQNSGLSAARNTAISMVRTPFVFILDADNHLYPRCVERCLAALEESEAAFAYPLIEQFEGAKGIIGNSVWSRDRLARGNYIDAMALIRRSAILDVGGYTYMPYGWEDYDLWCKFAERNYIGILIPEILARYRVHATSMLRSTTNKSKTIELIVDDMMQRHPWMQLADKTSENNDKPMLQQKNKMHHQLEFISIHIGKTAGSAFRHVLYQVLGQDNVLKDYAPCNYQLNEHLPDHIKAIHGHFPAEKYINCFPESKWIVWLRQPVFRLISEYFFAQAHQDFCNPAHVRLNQEKLELLEFAEQQEMRNVQFNQVKGKKLTDFYFVGLQEFYLEDLVDLKSKADWPEFTVSSANANLHPNYHAYVQNVLSDSSIVRQLVDWNCDDLDLYQEAMHLRAKRRQETAVLQYFLSGLQQTQPLIQHLQNKLYQLEAQLQSEQKLASSLEIIQLSDSQILENLLGFYIESPTDISEVLGDSVEIRGWAIGKQKKAVALKVYLNDQVLAETPINLYRSDVTREYPTSNVKTSGFQMNVSVRNITGDFELLLQVLLENEVEINIAIIRLTQSAL